MIEKTLSILDHQYRVTGDDDYLGAMGTHFEPDTCALLAALCDGTGLTLDIGANLGLTALALAQIAPQAKVLAFEPVANAYALLQKNIATNQIANVTTFNIALGNSCGYANLFVNDRNYASSFIVSTSSQQDSGQVPLQRLDDFLAQRDDCRIGFIKIDVEGYELEVLAGAAATLQRDQPIVLLEMNHWCLNVFRRISIPEFHERLLALFPVVFAVHENDVVDFRDPAHSGRIFHAHIVENRYMHIVAGFDREAIERRLAAVKDLAGKSDQAAATTNINAGSPPTTLSAQTAPAPFVRRLKRSLRILLGKEY